MPRENQLPPLHTSPRNSITISSTHSLNSHTALLHYMLISPGDRALAANSNSRYLYSRDRSISGAPSGGEPTRCCTPLLKSIINPMKARLAPTSATATSLIVYLVNIDCQRCAATYPRKTRAIPTALSLSQPCDGAHAAKGERDLLAGQLGKQKAPTAAPKTFFFFPVCIYVRGVVLHACFTGPRREDFRSPSVLYFREKRVSEKWPNPGRERIFSRFVAAAIRARVTSS